MLIRHTPDTFEKLHILGGMASDDILSRPTSGNRTPAPYTSARRNPVPGVYKAAMPNGKYISLMRVMFTDFCKMDCFYCPNSHWVPRKRYAFKVDELANAFMEMHRRHMVNGMFLSSGIAGSGSKTTERLLKVVDVIRNKHGFKGYIHMKVMPGAEYEYVEAAYRLGTRLSVNMETPTVEHMQKLSKMKDLKRDILDPMEWVHNLTESHTNGAVGQATQLVVGAADESDRDIFGRMDQLYTEWKFKRIYYAPFQPVRYTPLEEHPPTPMARSHRLYQVDWLKRVYRFSNDELDLAFSDNGFLPLDQDPKTSIAVENLDAFPMDINHADKDQLLRIPGVGPTSAERIVRNRRNHSIDTWRDLTAMGVVRKRAWPFLVFPGHRPPRAKQLKLDLFGEDTREKRRAPTAETAPQPAAPCGERMSCTGCPMLGMPGHPSADGLSALPMAS
jgi:predicted DNA-binding helix-hairpin-helix protein